MSFSPSCAALYNLLSILLYVGFSLELTLTSCESSFGVQTVEYRCTHDGSLLEWIVEPVIMRRKVRFSSDTPLRSLRVGDILITLNSTYPLISRLRIPDHDALATATVICKTESGRVNANYTSNSYSKLNIIIVTYCIILAHVKFSH